MELVTRKRSRSFEENTQTNGHGHHHEEEEGVDQIVNDKTIQRGEGKLEHVLGESVSNRSEGSLRCH